MESACILFCLRSHGDLCHLLHAPDYVTRNRLSVCVCQKRYVIGEDHVCSILCEYLLFLSFTSINPFSFIIDAERIFFSNISGKTGEEMSFTEKISGNFRAKMSFFCNIPGTISAEMFYTENVSGMFRNCYVTIIYPFKILYSSRAKYSRRWNESSAGRRD